MLPFFTPPKDIVVPPVNTLPTLDLPQPIGRYGIYRPPAPNPIEQRLANSLERAKKKNSDNAANNFLFL
jgi:hypothetical protein